MRKDILVVDDDPGVIYTIKRGLEILDKEYNVLAVESGVECLELLEKGFKGILLIDIMMPNMDGWDTIREIVNRGLKKNVEILVITAVGTSNHEKMKGLEPYIYDYIAKPFDVNTIVESVKRLN